MSQGGSTAHRLKEALAKQEALHEKLRSEGLPPPQVMYAFNQSQWIHHIMVMTLERIVQEKLGMSQDEFRLMVTETWISELEKLSDTAREMKSQQLRAELTRGIQIKPDVQL